MQPAIGILLMIWVLLASFGLGALFLRLFPKTDSRSGHFVLSVGLGFGIIIYMMMALGYMRLWNTAVIYGFLIVISVPGIINIGHLRWRGGNKTALWLSKFSVIVGSILLAHIAVNLMGDLVPPLNGDTIGMYLVWPKMWVQNHGIYEIYSKPLSFMPSNAPVLSSLGLLLRDDILAELLTGFLMCVLGCMTVYTIARKQLSREISLLSAALFYCTPLIIGLSYSAKVDPLMAFFELLAFYSFFNYYFENDDRKAGKWLLLSAVFCGLSAGTKLFAFTSVIIGFTVLMRCLKAGYAQRNIWRDIKYVICFVLVAAIVGSPWYIRNLICFGNPVYPLLSETMHIISLIVKRTEGSGLLGYFSMFWSWSTRNPYMGVGVGPIFMFSIPCLLFMRKIDGYIKVLLILVLAYSILCYVTVARPRHMLAGIGLLSIIAGYAITRMTYMQKTLKYGVTALVTTMLLFNLSLDVWRNLIITPKIPYIIGSIDREEFLRRTLTKGFPVPYSMMRFINDKLPNNATILGIGPFTSYYIDKPILEGWDCIFLKDEREVEPYLLGKGVDYIFVNPYTSPQFSGENYLFLFRKAFNDSPLFSDNYAKKHLKLLFSVGDKYLFEWVPNSQNNYGDIFSY